MRKSELKPCPFCGGQATFVTSLHITGEYSAIAMCERCKAKTDSMRAHDEEDAEVMAAACWNTRAEITCDNFGGEEGTNGEGYDFACSSCGWCGDVPDPNFCPNCGARVMEVD